MFQRSIICLVILLLPAHGADSSPPRVLDDRFKLELVASEPEIVTPVGLAFDSRGRLLVVESHTHNRPDNYAGPKHDRILAFNDSDGDGRLDHSTTFADGLRDVMNLLVRPDGAVYVVTGKRLLLLRDTSGDGVADEQQLLLRLETEAPNPHNSLNGIARQSPGGGLLIGLGQTRTFPYRLIDAQGNELSATDGAGSIFHINESGGNLTRVATGFWNPFSICILPDGRVFAVDNDPDDRPPCRLLHIVFGGDYGYRYQYTRGGTHPLQAWNGELPGTLPMVCGTGEGPTAIVPHAGSLWVTSWGDHRIERYRLVPRGASYGAEREVVVQGNADFRPTGMAVAPDGSLYFADWVKRDYPVHGKGRIWRLVLPWEELKKPFPPRTDEDRTASSFRFGGSIVATESDDPFVFTSGVSGFSRSDDLDMVGKLVPGSPMSKGLRLSKLQAWRLRGTEKADSILREALQDESAEVRLFAVRWIADERITALRDEVTKLLDGPQPSRRYYLAVLAAIDWLEHGPELRAGDFQNELLVRELGNEQRSPKLRTLALSLLSPDDPFLTVERLRHYLQAQHLPLRLEAVRALVQRSDSARFELLAKLAHDAAQPLDVRLEATMGLSGNASKHQELLERLAERDSSATLQREAERILRISGLRSPPAEQKPSADDLSAWYDLLAESGDAQAGRRLFFSSVGSRCSVCHQFEGRGGKTGPDLTHIEKGASRARIIASILQPSQEIAPDYQPWLLITKDGRSHVGLRSSKPVGEGLEHYVNSAGALFTLPSHEIESRQAATVSIMPQGIDELHSISDLRDLVAFLIAPAEE